MKKKPKGIEVGLPFFTFMYSIYSIHSSYLFAESHDTPSPPVVAAAGATRLNWFANLCVLAR
jgi:hypothetical protein